MCIDRTISAMLNSQGGKIYLGITDDGVVEGLTMNHSQVYQIGMEISINLGKTSHLVEMRKDEEFIFSFCTTIVTILYFDPLFFRCEF